MRCRSSLFLFGTALVSLVIAACGNDQGFFQLRHWGEWTIRLETRPHPIQAGHNEFLLHVVGPPGHRLPGGMIVRYRLSEHDAWIQAMPDGMSDVFRRALTVKDPAHAVLHVHLSYAGKETELRFVLSPRRPES